jgi:hypothetical protein
MFTKSSLMFATVLSVLSFPAFSAADPNMPRDGLYTWKMKTESDHKEVNTKVISKSDNTGATTDTYTKDGKSETRNYAGGAPQTRCIDTSKLGSGMEKKAGCTVLGKPERGPNSTKATSVCSGMKITVENKKVSENVYEVSSEIDMKGTTHKSVTVLTRVGDCK